MGYSRQHKSPSQSARWRRLWSSWSEALEAPRASCILWNAESKGCDFATGDDVEMWWCICGACAPSSGYRTLPHQIWSWHHIYSILLSKRYRKPWEPLVLLTSWTTVFYLLLAWDLCGLVMGENIPYSAICLSYTFLWECITFNSIKVVLTLHLDVACLLLLYCLF